ncbi:MAG: DUF4386 domain-containing protein [Anaerolineaceae bacterium]|nr:DUF4386 domain-containing protein [Anaerolineaceae bacterium]
MSINKMNSDKSTIKLLGAAFLIQAIASGVGFILLDPLIVPGNIVDSMVNIANNIFQLRASIVFQMITAMGIVMLGTLLFVTLKKQNQNIAIVAMGLYIIEAAILAVSRIPAFLLIQISQESVITGHPAYLQSLGSLFVEAAEFGDSLHMLVFGIGATLFYSLFFKSKYIPRALSLFGLIAAPIALVGTILILLGIDFPLIFMLPNLPFELGIGLWLLIKGIRDGSETK